MRGHLALTSGWPRPIAAGPIEPGRKRGRPRGPEKPPKAPYVRIRKIPREVRAQLYQLELTRLETCAEIRRIFDGFGLAKDGRNKQMQRIVEERGE